MGLEFTIPVCTISIVLALSALGNRLERIARALEARK